MQPAGARPGGRAGATAALSFGDEAFQSLAEADVEPSDVFFHKYDSLNPVTYDVFFHKYYSVNRKRSDMCSSTNTAA